MRAGAAAPSHVVAGLDPTKPPDIMAHIVLLGDSVFDNVAYVPGEPDVVRQLRALLTPADTASLLAVDGAVVRSVPEQLRRMPADATHLVVSVGGNDALGQVGLLEDRTPSIGDALLRLSDVVAGFAAAYRAMAEALAQTGRPSGLCTIYDPRFPDPRLQRLAVTALPLFNDVILREAIRRGWPAIDLRAVCSEPEDFANPIEPSARGGEKIARTVAALVREHPFGRGYATVFGPV